MNLFKPRCFTCNKKFKWGDKPFTVKMTTHSRKVCSECASVLVAMRQLGQIKYEADKENE